jgi:hypothetical protein
MGIKSSGGRGRNIRERDNGFAEVAPERFERSCYRFGK